MCGGLKKKKKNKNTHEHFRGNCHRCRSHLVSFITQQAFLNPFVLVARTENNKNTKNSHINLITKMTDNPSSEVLPPSVPQLSTQWNTKEIPINEVTSFNNDDEYQVFELLLKQYNNCLNFNSSSYHSSIGAINQKDIDEHTNNIIMTANIRENKKCHCTIISTTTTAEATSRETHLYDSIEN